MHTAIENLYFYIPSASSFSSTDYLYILHHKLIYFVRITLSSLDALYIDALSPDFSLVARFFIEQIYIATLLNVKVPGATDEATGGPKLSRTDKL